MSDWSSDVCSSDLPPEVPGELVGDPRLAFYRVALALEQVDDAGQVDIAEPAVIGPIGGKQDGVARALFDPERHLPCHARKQLGLQRGCLCLENRQTARRRPEPPDPTPRCTNPPTTPQRPPPPAPQTSNAPPPPQPHPPPPT